MTYQERKELNDLSKEVFGTSSRWAKIVQNGTIDVLERDREVMVPGLSGPEKKTFKDQKQVIKRYSVEDVRKLMEEILEKRKAITQVVEAKE